MTIQESLHNARQYIQTFAAERGLLNDSPTQALLDELDNNNKYLPVSAKALVCWEYLVLLQREDLDIKLSEVEIKILKSINNEILISLLEYIKEKQNDGL